MILFARHRTHTSAEHKGCVLLSTEPGTDRLARLVNIPTLTDAYDVLLGVVA